MSFIEFEQTIFNIITAILFCVFLMVVLWPLYVSYFKEWRCKECKRIVVGHNGRKTGHYYGIYCEECFLQKNGKTFYNGYYSK